MKHHGLNSPFLFSLLCPPMKYRQLILKQQIPQEKEKGLGLGKSADPGGRTDARELLFANSLTPA